MLSIHPSRRGESSNRIAIAQSQQHPQTNFCLIWITHVARICPREIHYHPCSRFRRRPQCEPRHIKTLEQQLTRAGGLAKYHLHRGHVPYDQPAKKSPLRETCARALDLNSKTITMFNLVMSVIFFWPIFGALNCRRKDLSFCWGHWLPFYPTRNVCL